VRLLTAVLLGATSAVTLAQNAPPLKPGLWQMRPEMTGEDAQRMAQMQQQLKDLPPDVRKQMENDGRYVYVRPDEREKVETSLTEMGRLFDEHESVAQMDKPTQVKLFNAQENVNAILTLRDRDRLICERGASTGSRIVGTSCRTYGDIEAARQAGNKFMLERAATPCAANCTGK